VIRVFISIFSREFLKINILGALVQKQVKPIKTVSIAGKDDFA
jgi:hypothetical protein